MPTPHLKVKNTPAPGIGYLPTPKQHQLGGYETWRARSSYLEADAAPKIFDTLMALFARLN